MLRSGANIPVSGGGKTENNPVGEGLRLGAHEWQYPVGPVPEVKPKRWRHWAGALEKYYKGIVLMSQGTFFFYIYIFIYILI